jgi:ribosome-binding ATPase YchF (GTP1/OBG family)
MKIGLVGFAGSGKSTVFRWLTGVEPDPSKIQQGQTGMSHVPDERLAKIITKFKPKKSRYAEVAFLDTPGLMMDERKDNPRRLGILREGNGLVIVLDGFSGADLKTQLSRFQDELLFADLDIVANRIEKVQAQLKKNRPLKEKELDQAELEILQRIHSKFEANESLASLSLKTEEEKLIRSLQLLTLKPQMALVNRGETIPTGLDSLGGTTKVLAAPVKLEMELQELDDESKQMFMSDLGITEMSRDTIIRELFYGMGRIVFFTVGEDECRSWAINRGATAVEGAGAIHTDLSKNFIRAEVMSHADFLASGYSEKDCKAAGTFRLESKDYLVQDGDIMHIRAN